MYTFNEINKAFNNIAVAHSQISTYGIGDIWEIATSGDIRYPMMWAKPENASLETSIYVSNWTLIFMDVVDNGERNENDVLSDMEQVALDVVALLRDPSYDFDFKYEGSSIERFTERFEDKVAGVLLKIAIRVPYEADRCQVPQSGLTITGSAGSAGAVTPCSDATAILANSSGTNISTTSIVAGATANITAPNGTAILYNTSGTTIATIGVGSNATEHITAPNGTVIVNTVDGTQMGSKVVASGGNGVITLTDSDMYDTLPIVYNFPQPTGQTTSYATGDDGNLFATVWDVYWATTNVGKRPQLTDFLTLLSNNSFGNTLRFTDSVGGTTYGAGNGSIANYVIDHYTGLGWYLTLQAATTWATAISNAEAFATSFTDWFIPNTKQYDSLANMSLSNSALNYAPFNFNTNGEEHWTSTTSPGTTTQAYTIIWRLDAANMSYAYDRGIKASVSLKYWLCRKHF